MANLPLAFAELAAGSVLLIAGLQNKTPRQVLLGEASTASPAAGGSPASTPSANGSTPVPGVSGIPNSSPQLGAGIGSRAASQAVTYLNVPYLLNGITRAGIDCSGLVLEAYKAVGVDLPRTAAQQWLFVQQHGTVKSLSQLVAGDLVFLEPTSTGPGHVAIALGNGEAVEAPHTGDHVKIINLQSLVNADHFVGAGSPY